MTNGGTSDAANTLLKRIPRARQSKGHDIKNQLLITSICFICLAM